MENDINFLSSYGCYDHLSLEHVLGIIPSDTILLNENVSLIDTSHYCNLEYIRTLLPAVPSSFTILNINIQYLNAILDELAIILNDLNKNVLKI